MSLRAWEAAQVWIKMGFPAPPAWLYPSHLGMGRRRALVGRIAWKFGLTTLSLQEFGVGIANLEVSPCPCRNLGEFWGGHCKFRGVTLFLQEFGE